MSQSDLELLEVQMDQAKAAITLSDELRKLEDNIHFKRLILEEYLEQEPIRLCRLKVDPAMQSELNQRMIDNQIIGIGNLHMFLRKIHQIAQAMRESMQEMENTHEELTVIEGGGELQ